MTLDAKSQIEETAHYTFASIEDDDALLFRWKPVAGLSARDFRNGIAAFAGLCKARRPARAVIDARALDQGSPAVAWLRGQDGDAEAEDYVTWWSRDIVPIYCDAGISSLAVATGDPNAPGELASLPPGVSFKVGYFPDLDATIRWKPE